LVSLAGDSKKIPINILSNDSLSISKLGNFAKDTDYFHSNKKEGSYQIKQKFSPK